MPNSENIIKLESEYRKGLSSVNKLVKIFQDIRQSEKEIVIIDLRECEYIHPSYASVIAAMPYIGDTYNKKISIRYEKNKKCESFLDSNGILTHYQKKIKYHQKPPTTIGFNCITKKEEVDVTINKLLGNLPVNISEKLHDELYSKIYEVFINAFTHSGTDRVYFSGSPDSQKSFVFTVYDTGIGIPQNVKNFLNKDINSKVALEWALTSGNSTLRVDYPRGAGFSVLESFVKINNGDIVIASGNAYSKITKYNKKVEELPNAFLGTFFSITVKKDRERKYLLKSEL